MREMMIDLETEDTIPSAIVRSLGAVVWQTSNIQLVVTEPGFEGVSKPTLTYDIIERLYRHPDAEMQRADGRTSSIETLKWWATQDRDAFDECFIDSKLQCSIETMFRDLLLMASAHGVTRFWASPATFDFPILNTLAHMYGLSVPWSYNQMFDVRTTVLEASYSAKDHVPLKEIAGKPHMPVTDCEWQIDLLTGARAKLGKRMAG